MRMAAAGRLGWAFEEMALDLVKKRLREQKWRDENREHVRARARRRHAANPEKGRARARAYYRANKDMVKKYTRKYALANPDKVRAYNLKHLFGLSVVAFQDLVRQQGGTCAGCLAQLPPHMRACVDHDHQTGRVRGLLCQGCNIALGRVHDVPETLERLAAYLRKGVVR